ncbi:PE-PGRS family protein [Parafrankia sp. EUN1f]|nr:PE-PGRS family protein [Parafrankia sp. EUN1f]
MRARLQGAAATTVSPTRERRSSPSGTADWQPGSGNRGQGVTTRHETASSRNRPYCRPHPARDGSYPPTVGQVRLGPDHAEWPDGPQTRGVDSYTQRTTNLPGSLADDGGRPGAASGSAGRPGRWLRRPSRRARMRYGSGATSACTQVSGRPAAARPGEAGPWAGPYRGSGQAGGTGRGGAVRGGAIRGATGRCRPGRAVPGRGSGVCLADVRCGRCCWNTYWRNTYRRYTYWWNTSWWARADGAAAGRDGGATPTDRQRWPTAGQAGTRAGRGTAGQAMRAMRAAPAQVRYRTEPGPGP